MEKTGTALRAKAEEIVNNLLKPLQAGYGVTTGERRAAAMIALSQYSHRIQTVQLVLMVIDILEHEKGQKAIAESIASELIDLSYNGYDPEA